MSFEEIVDGRTDGRTTDKYQSQKLTLRTPCSGELKIFFETLKSKDSVEIISICNVIEEF